MSVQAPGRKLGGVSKEGRSWRAGQPPGQGHRLTPTVRVDSVSERMPTGRPNMSAVEDRG